MPRAVFVEQERAAADRLDGLGRLGRLGGRSGVVVGGLVVGFLANLGGEGVNFAYAGAILLGGVIAAPFAAWLVRHFPPRLLGASVGGLIILTNAKTLMGKSGLALDPGTQRAVYILIVAGWIAAFAYSFVQYRRDAVLESADSIADLAARNASTAGEAKETVPA